MPPTLTAPGVYVQELAPENRTISGVSTSLTAFVGPAARGPVDEPTRINSWSEFERVFGGLSTTSTMSQAVRHYFLNGGSTALIVRVVNGELLVLSATAEALAIPGFDHLRATVTPTGGTTFDLQLDLVDAAGAVLDDGDAYSVTVALDTAAPDPAAIDAAVTAHGPAVALATALGDFPTAVPVAGQYDAPAHAPGTVVLGIGATGAVAVLDVGLRLAATTAVAAVAGFDHLNVAVSNSDAVAGTFDLTITAEDNTDTTLDDGGVDYSVVINGLDITGAYGAQIDAALTATATPIVLATVDGAAPVIVPPNGAAVSADVGGVQVVTLAAERLVLAASSAGGWGNRLRAEAFHDDAQRGAFHLRLAEVETDGSVVAEEFHYNVSTDPMAEGWIERVLDERSTLVGVQSTSALASFPAAVAAEVAFTGGVDGATPRITEDLQGSEASRTGMYALLAADLFNMLCLPLDGWSTTNNGEVALWSAALELCRDERAIAIVDPPSDWTTAAAATAGATTLILRNDNAAMYFPGLRAPDPLIGGRLAAFPPCGVVAGAIARTDAQRGVWKAPAGIDVNLFGVPELTIKLTDPEQGQLNQLGINCLRAFPVYGRVVWGARTLRGADVMASHWKYLPVRRLALYLEESLQRGSQWAVFEGNAEPLWSQLRLSIGAFMQDLFLQGAFQGTSARDAYFVKCDAETTPPADRDRGVVNVIVGFAPLKPAEFVIIKLQQTAAQPGS